MENFDSLFENFLNSLNKENERKPERKPENVKITDLPQEVQDEINAIMHMYEDFTQMLDTTSGENMVAELGPPDETEMYSENGVNYEKMTWFTDKGQLVQLAIRSDDFKGMDYPRQNKELSLEKQLEIALADENYLKAATIRDNILIRDKI